tara:strand:+ start:251 stop:547 length:297 start_codon:yes stop_codon:yes gene_type:complete
MNSNDVYTLKKQIDELRLENDRLQKDGEAAATALVKYVVENQSPPTDGVTARKNWEADARLALKAVKLYMINRDGLHKEPDFADYIFETARDLFKTND